MNDQTVQLTEELTYGPQPTVEQFRQLASRGYRAIINLRHDGEDEQPLSPADEGTLVRQLGLDYVNVPVSLRTAQAETVDRFRKELSRLPAPVYVHCKSGAQAGAMAIVDLAVRQQMSGEQALARARELGIDPRDERLVELIKTYVDGRRVLPV